MHSTTYEHVYVNIGYCLYTALINTAQYQHVDGNKIN